MLPLSCSTRVLGQPTTAMLKQACHLLIVISVAAAVAQTLRDATSDASRPVASDTLVSNGTGCPDGYTIVRGLCRGNGTRGQRSRVPTTTAPTTTSEEVPFSEPTETRRANPTRVRCRLGYLYVKGRCRKILKRTKPGSADSQPTSMSENVPEPTVSAISDSVTTKATQKPVEHRMCPEGSTFKFGVCLSPVIVRLVTLPKHCPDGFVLIEDSCRKIEH